MKFKVLQFVILFSGFAFAQLGFEIEKGTIIRPDTTLISPTETFYIQTNREDVKAIGMGKTQVANGKYFNAMLYNPALLSRSRFTIDAISVGVSMPPETYDAANYLSDHIEEFESALSLKELWAGVSEFNNAQTMNDQLLAIKKIQDGIRFPRELMKNVIGSSENPTLHGARTIPAVSLQVGNFGFTLYGLAQSAFIVEQNPLMDALLAVKIPDDLNNAEEVLTAVATLEGLLQPLAEYSTWDLVLPFAVSASYVDIVGAAGYAYNFTPNFSAGVNLKAIHRRFAVNLVLFKDYKNILNIFKRDLDNSITGFTMDIGFLYRLPTKTEIGLSVQNIIPVQKISSTLNTSVVISYLDTKKDAQGNVVVQPDGDVVYQSITQNLHIRMPFDLKLPIVVNLGAVHAITPDWDVALDWVDIAKQESLNEEYIERFRIGTEYRLDAVKEKLGVAFRAGMADSRFTGGIGFNIYKVLQLDGAYAYDSYVGVYSYFAQIKLGW
jgi:hypothetical protein